MNILEQIKNGALTDPTTFLGAMFYALVFLFFAWLFGHALHLAVQRLFANDKNNRVDRTAVKFLAQLARLIVYIFMFISYAHLVPALAGLGTAWLASAGILSVIIGLAAQNTLGNLIAGISLLLYRPFNVGDRLQVTAPTGVEKGTVESINLGYTLLKTDDNRHVVVPNSSMASQTHINLTNSFAAATPSSAPSQQPTIAEYLDELQQLREKELVTEEEYKAKREEILGRL
ncbi:MAG TPA: mechanosensitive ion channel domain-containing protein [Anaerolineaceae bacterium]|nr:mechanosensitive ion channel domain-containing protein [Anaerolineaceae bacterium]